MVPRLWFLFLFLTLIVSSNADSSILRPQEFRSFKIQKTQSANRCSYTVSIKTSCSSRSYTRDAVGLAFGDAYGNEVYVPRLDDPSSGTFERCSTDTFMLSGPCTYRICYLYLLRQGSDGWKPDSVKISTSSSRTVTFNYGTFLPNGIWYGFNLCDSASILNGNGDNQITEM